MTNPYLGRTIANYRLDAVLGDGGMGTVFQAHDLNLDRKVAVKLMHAHFASRPEFRDRLRQEAKTAAGVDHPSIVRIFDFGETDELSFIVMEYIAGGSLRQHLARVQSQQRFLPLQLGIQVGYQIADALQYAHGRGLVHRDVKPSNIILKQLPRPDEPNELPVRAVLTDFGLVKLLEGDRLTQSGATLGTPIYMSPEQCRGQVLDGRSDLYSLGVVLYELLTNRLPFQFKSLAEAIETHARGEMPPDPIALNPSIPSVIGPIIVKLLAKSPGDRYQTAGELSVALRAAYTAMSDDPTEVYSKVMPAPAPEQVVHQPPAGYVLTIETPGYPPSDVPLSKSPIALGRSADNDIVLPATGVSRQHRFWRAVVAGWTVEDNDSANGTMLNGVLVPATTAAPFRPGDELRIGPYRLVLTGPEMATEEMAVTPVMAAVATAAVATAAAPHNPGAPSQTPAPGAPLELFISRDTITLDPGQATELTLDIANRGEQPDRVSLQLQGLSNHWVILEEGYINVAAHSSTSTILRIQLPRESATIVGRHRFRVTARSQAYPDVRPAISASLIVESFSSFEAGMEPTELGVPDTVEVTIRNTGNIALDFGVVGRDTHDQLRFEGERGRVQVAASEQAVVPLDVSARNRPIIGSGDTVPFEVDVRARSATGQAAGQQALDGAARVQPLVPAWLQYALLALIVFSCVTISLFVLFGDRLSGGGNASATGTVSAMTATAISQKATEIAIQATLDAATNQPLGSVTPDLSDPNGDPDQDGLTNVQENAAGTDKLNPDTDSDGLTDGEEVLLYGCDPHLLDTDFDTFSDFEESKILESNCNDPNDPVSMTGTATATGTFIVPSATTGPPTPVTRPPITRPPPTPTSPPPPTSTSPPPPSPTPTSPPDTPTPTETVAPPDTPTPTDVPPAPPVFALACTTVIPTIDGVLDDITWSTGPVLTVVSPSNPSRIVQLYGVKGGANYYFAAQITDNTTAGPSNAFNLFFDVNHSGGPPDVQDRWFEVWRNGTTSAMYRGTGAGWSTAINSTEWVSATSLYPSNPWIVEMGINAVELNGMSDPFGFMMEVVFGDGTLLYQTDSNQQDTSTWPSVINPDCPPVP